MTRGSAILGRTAALRRVARSFFCGTMLCFTTGLAAGADNEAQEHPALERLENGEYHDTIVAPYLDEALARSGLDAACLERALFEQPPDAGEVAVAIGAPARATRNWSYLMSDTIRIYEALVLEPGNERRLAVLHADAPPGDQIAPGREVIWQVSTIDSQCEMVEERAFGVWIVHEAETLWDMIEVELRLSPDSTGLIAIIGYFHTGSGGPQSQVFEADFGLSGGLILNSVRQTVDEFEF